MKITVTEIERLIPRGCDSARCYLRCHRLQGIKGTRRGPVCAGGGGARGRSGGGALPAPPLRRANFDCQFVYERPLYWTLRSTVTRFYLHFANMEMSFLLYINVFEDDWWDREDINKAINCFIWDSFDWDQAAWALLPTKLVASSCALRLRSPQQLYPSRIFFHMCLCRIPCSIPYFSSFVTPLPILFSLLCFKQHDTRNVFLYFITCNSSQKHIKSCAPKIYRTSRLLSVLIYFQLKPNELHLGFYFLSN